MLPIKYGPTVTLLLTYSRLFSFSGPGVWPSCRVPRLHTHLCHRLVRIKPVQVRFVLSNILGLLVHLLLAVYFSFL
jgi:hypothetical protein